MQKTIYILLLKIVVIKQSTYKNTKAVTQLLITVLQASQSIWKTRWREELSYRLITTKYTKWRCTESIWQRLWSMRSSIPVSRSASTAFLEGGTRWWTVELKEAVKLNRESWMGEGDTILHGPIYSLIKLVGGQGKGVDSLWCADILSTLNTSWLQTCGL